MTLMDLVSYLYIIDKALDTKSLAHAQLLEYKVNFSFGTVIYF